MQEQADDEEEQQGVGYYKCTHYMLAEWLNVILMGRRVVQE